MSLTSDTNKIAASRAASWPIAVQVIRHEVIAPNVVTLSLAQPGTKQAPSPYLPGQFITLAVPGNNGNIYRSYSLCGNGNPRYPWEITLKRFPDGLVSNYLFDNVRVGMILHTLPPRGVFILPASLRPEQTFVFVAVGSGISPIRGFLRTIASLPPGSRPKVQLHYASRSAQETIYRDEILKLDWLRQKHYLRTEGLRMTPSQIFANASPLSRNAQWYICGPEAFNLQFSTRRCIPEWRAIKCVTISESSAVFFLSQRAPHCLVLFYGDHRSDHNCQHSWCPFPGAVRRAGHTLSICDLLGIHDRVNLLKARSIQR